MDVMMDYETMALGPNAAVVSLGAIAFERTGTLPPVIHPSPTNPLGFYRTIDLQSSIDLGLEIDGKTVMFWLQQPERARQALATPEPVSVRQAHEDFAEFFLRTVGSKGRVWANGADFDTVIATGIFKRLGITCPWQYWNVEHTRTIYNAAHIRLPNAAQRVVPHHAFYDAVVQAEYVQRACKILGGESRVPVAAGREKLEETDL